MSLLPGLLADSPPGLVPSHSPTCSAQRQTRFIVGELRTATVQPAFRRFCLSEYPCSADKFAVLPQKLSGILRPNPTRGQITVSPHRQPLIIILIAFIIAMTLILLAVSHLLIQLLRTVNSTSQTGIKHVHVTITICQFFFKVGTKTEI